MHSYKQDPKGAPGNPSMWRLSEADSPNLPQEIKEALLKIVEEEGAFPGKNGTEAGRAMLQRYNEKHRSGQDPLCFKVSKRYKDASRTANCN